MRLLLFYQDSNLGHHSGFNTTTLSGGSVISIECGRPWLLIGSDILPGKFPRLLPA
jgi:hypothetical protein